MSAHAMETRETGYPDKEFQASTNGLCHYAMQQFRRTIARTGDGVRCDPSSLGESEPGGAVPTPPSGLTTTAAGSPGDGG